MTGEERFRQGSNRLQAIRRAVFRIRQRPDVFEVYRLRDDDALLWNIEGVSHYGYYWTDLTCAADVSDALPIAT